MNTLLENQICKNIVKMNEAVFSVNLKSECQLQLDVHNSSASNNTCRNSL